MATWDRLERMLFLTTFLLFPFPLLIRVLSAHDFWRITLHLLHCDMGVGDDYFLTTTTTNNTTSRIDHADWTSL